MSTKARPFVETDASQTLMRNYLEYAARIKDQDINRDLLSTVVDKFVALEKRVDALLKNTLPPTVADEIKYSGTFAPRSYDCTILFCDVAGFTSLAERLSSSELVAIIDSIFDGFDQVVTKFQGTKIKTIGDAYMVVFGAPMAITEHASLAVRTAAEMLTFLNSFNHSRFGSRREHYFRCRIGIHSGMVTAGVVGSLRMQFDVFGDTVNIASRFESTGEAGRINISEDTRQLLPAIFSCADRGEVALKNRGLMRAYFVTAISDDHWQENKDDR